MWNKPNGCIIELPGSRANGANVRVEEITEYLDLEGEQLYCVHHLVEKPRAQIVLAGPFASERSSGYIPWVRWARFLATEGFHATRFDYRGVGESTGQFREMSFSTWVDDILAVARRTRNLCPGCPLVLHGIGLGGLLVAHAFRSIGDALLMWSAPQSGADILRDALKRQLAVNFGQEEQAAGPRNYNDFVAELEAGKGLEVEGYRWSNRLWKEASTFALTEMGPGRSGATPNTGKPWKHVALNQSHFPLISGAGTWLALSLNPVLRKVALNPDFQVFFGENARWISDAISG